MRKKNQNFRLVHLNGTETRAAPGMNYEVQVLDRIYRSIAEGYFNNAEDPLVVGDITIPPVVLAAALELEPNEFIVVNEAGEDVWNKLMGR